MTKEQAIELARQAGAGFMEGRQYHAFTDAELERFAALVRNAALEEAAKATIPHSDVIAATQAIRNLKVTP